ncbi:MAG: hypothetical protein CM1200mP10_28210 [Candidatus Neomarinimicrobiota bacterium]|nr:MAG: hypothetical protein CM1200mP10_28210 [Candidatus Neomarinimicrobiota bacterium]
MVRYLTRIRSHPAWGTKISLHGSEPEGAKH